MSTVGAVDKVLEKWISKTWKKKTGGQAALVKEIAVGHFKGPGAPETVCVLTKDTLDSYADSHELARDIDERMVEHARFHAGNVRFQIVIWGGEGPGMRPLASTECHRQGQGTPEPDTFDPSAQGQLTMYMREAHRDRELTIATLKNQIDKLDSRNERLHNIVDQMMARYPELLDLMNRLADGEVEREIKRRQSFRIEGLKDRAIQRLDQAFPHILSAVTGGKLNLLTMGAPAGTNAEMMAQIEPYLVRLMKSLMADDARGKQIIDILNPEEQQCMLVIGATIEQYLQKAKEKADVKDIEVKQSTNGTPNASAPPAP